MSTETENPTPRVPLVPPEEWDADILAFIKRAVPGEERLLNFFQAMVHHPKLMEKWTVFAARILGKGILPKRDREIIVLRTVWVCGATYEFVHHAEIGAENGLAPAEIDAIKTGPDAPGWATNEVALLRAVDELHRDDVVSDETFAALLESYDYASTLEIIMLIGQYTLVSYFVRSFGVPLEPEVLARNPAV